MAFIRGTALVAAARKQVGKRKYSSMCQAFCVITSGIGAKGDFDRDGDADAVDGWKKASARGLVVRAEHIKSYKDIPAGTLVYWTGGSRGYGHVAITVGNGRIISTDAPRWGTIGEVDLGYIASTWKNGLKFVGYIINDGDGHEFVKPVIEPKPAAQSVREVVGIESSAYTINCRGVAAATFPSRAKILAAEINDASPSIVLAQELYSAIRSSLDKRLPDYQMVHAYKGKVIYIHKDRWRKVRASSHALGNGKHAAAALIEHRASGERIVVSSGHLSYAANDYAKRKAETREWINGVVAEYPNIPKMLGGDWNCDRHGGDWAGKYALTRNYHDAESNTPLVMHGEYDTYNGNLREAPKNGSHIDRFLMTSALIATRLRVDTHSYPYGSDHFGVAMRFTLIPQK